MHLTNAINLERLSKSYPTHFNNCSVIEFGSLNINGTVRKFFKDCDFIGVDWRSGPCVDLISLAHAFEWEDKFDTVISCQMLEHDPYWKKSLDKMISLVKEYGILILSWGGANCAPHYLETAPDGKFHALKGEAVYNYLLDKIYIKEFGYEDDFITENRENLDLRLGRQCVLLVGTVHDTGPATIFKMDKEDKL